MTTIENSLTTIVMENQLLMNEESVNILSLPVELLVYIILFLPTVRDIVKLRYVSRRLLVVTETPSLWSEFVWPLYDRREERSVMNVLKTCGVYIKQLVLPNHVPPSRIAIMLSHCKNVTRLCLPSETIVDPKKLRNSLQHLQNLKQLEVQFLSDADIKPILQVSAGLKELTVHIQETLSNKQYSWLKEWKRNGCVPNHLTFVAFNFSPFSFEKSFFLRFLLREHTIPADHKPYFNLCYNFKVPLNLFPSLPDFQLEFGQQVALPFVRASSFGILGLNWDLLVLTNCICNDKTFYKAKMASSDCSVFKSVRDDMLNKNINTLNFVTEFDFEHCETLRSGHLEQLAIACPNLQRLNLAGNEECLSNLQGLQMIAQYCSSLCGLNLNYITVKKVEDQLLLWEILSDMKLTHLAVEVCIFQPLIGNREYLVGSFKKCSSLYALQLDAIYLYDACEECMDYGGQWSLLSCFPVLKYCKVQTDEDEDDVQEIIDGCKELICLSCTSYAQLSLSFTSHSNLQQLCLGSYRSNLPNIFMETVSAHGGLVHIIFDVNSVTVEGITSLVVNSPRLLTMIILTKQCVCNEHGSKINSKDIISGLRKRFPGRKLFTAGDCRVVQKYREYTLSVTDFLYGTDLGPLW